MPRPFIRMSLGDFEGAVSKYAWGTKKKLVDVHCTDMPDHAHFAKHGGLDCVEAMYRNHTNPDGKNWSDIAQHVTIDPEGYIWSGRSWNRSPASALGYNSPRVFMFEMIGLFDTGKDSFGGAQREVAHAVAAAIIFKFGLTAKDAIRFHREINHEGKTCPGSAVGKEEFIAGVERMLDERYRLKGFGLQPESNPWLDPHDAAPGIPLSDLLPELSTDGDEAGFDDGEHDHDDMVLEDASGEPTS
ncbi:MAG: N-acetylmuramoyl-L-alanine amidase [Rhodobacteraceae bacterium]|nr:N-acetylmuramoyl-L-alanine amidase [Paracoccaceae bacterium]